MPRKPKPFFDETTRAWRLRYKKILPDGTVKRCWHLCTGEGNYAKAVAKAGEIMGGSRPANSIETVAELIEAWLDEYQDPKGWYEDQLDSWDVYAGHLPMARLKGDHLDAYHAYLKRCRYIPRAYQDPTDEQEQADNGTPRCDHPQARVYSLRAIRAKVGAAHRVLRWGHKVGHLQVLLEKPRTPKTKPQPRDYAPEEIQALFSTLDEPIFKFIAETGCRPGEACGLKWAQIKKWRAQATQQDHKTRASTGQDRRIPITPAAMAIVEAQTVKGPYVFVNRFGNPYKPGGLRSMIRRAAAKAGIELQTTYGLRHSRAQSILDAGHSLSDVAAFLGHKHLATSEGYAQVRQDRVQELSENLASLVPPQPVDGSTPPKSRGGRSPQPRPAGKPQKKPAPASARSQRGGRRQAAGS